jgi:hypothetical protein
MDYGNRPPNLPTPTTQQKWVTSSSLLFSLNVVVVEDSYGDGDGLLTGGGNAGYSL